MNSSKSLKALLSVVAVLFGIGGVFFLFGTDDSLPQPSVSISADESAHASSETVITVEPGLPLSKISQKTATDSDSEQENPYLNHEVKARLVQVADTYAEQIQYPTFSKPIPNLDALQKYLPNRSVAAERALDPKDGNSPHIRLKTDKHQYFEGETIMATVILTGLAGAPWIEVQGKLVAKGQSLGTADGVVDARNPGTYHMSFIDLDITPNSGMDEYRVVASVAIDGKNYEIGTPITYEVSVATVTNVGMAEIRGEYLYIPLHVTTTKLGYHELGANLYAASSGKPLVHLTAQQELQAANELMPLTAHVASLKAGRDEGPYILKDISFTRMPSPPDFITEYGKSLQSSYPVNGFPFDEYDDVPYVDEDAQQRLEFLRQLGEVN